MRVAAHSIAALLAGAALCTGPEPSAEAEARWGFRGHEMAARAAAETLPEDVPDFFRDATDQLAWLGPEPDRWRVSARPAMDEAWRYDHYIDMENVPPGALDAADRYTFLRRLYAADITRPEQSVGFLPYRIVELHDRLTESWRRWREAPRGSAERRWLEERIVSDAGVLGHYVTDGSQPHHTTIHFDGWAAGVPNDEGFSTERGFHSRFERFFVDAHVSLDDLRARLPAEATEPAAARGSGATRDVVHAYLERSFETVPELYRIERDHGFVPGGTPAPEAQAFAADRLAAGAEMLAALWLSAWRGSAR